MKSLRNRLLFCRSIALEICSLGSQKEDFYLSNSELEVPDLSPSRILSLSEQKVLDLSPSRILSPIPYQNSSLAILTTKQRERVACPKTSSFNSLIAIDFAVVYNAFIGCVFRIFSSDKLRGATQQPSLQGKTLRPPATPTPNESFHLSPLRANRKH